MSTPAFPFASLTSHPGNGAKIRWPVPQVKSKPFVHVLVAFLEAANKAGACAGCVAPLVWYQQAVTDSRSYKISNQAAAKFGIGRRRKTTGLRQLEAAGLIALQSSNGGSPVVTLLWSDGQSDLSQSGHLPVL